MLKFLLVVGFFFFIIYSLLIAPFKPRRSVNERKTYKKRPIDGNVNIDYDPSDKSKKNKTSGTSGEYVDYEEVE